MDKLQIFNNPEFGQVRAIEVDGEPWFVGKDVAAALGYRDTADALKRHVDEEDKLTWCFTDSGQSREMYVINESGLYSLILSSKLSQAKSFKRWVTSEVLPSIRKTGHYALHNTYPLNPVIASSVADLGRVTERIMKSEGARPHKIAETFKMQCEQFGIKLPEDFVVCPAYEQVSLFNILKL